MKSTFTPGPWKVVKPGHGHKTNGRCVQIGKDENYTTLELKPADAKLIAATPDLLAACEAVADIDLLEEVECVLDGLVTKRLTIKNVSAFRDAVDLLNDAIAKATK